MTDPIAEFIRRSREIEGRATPGKVRHECIREAPRTKEFATRQLHIGDRLWCAKTPFSLEEHDRDFNDGEALAHARNTHRALLDALEKAVAQIDDDLKHFHGTYCGLEEFGDKSCCNGCISLRDSKKEIESLLAEVMKEN